MGYHGQADVSTAVVDKFRQLEGPGTVVAAGIKHGSDPMTLNEIRKLVSHLAGIIPAAGATILMGLYDRTVVESEHALQIGVHARLQLFTHWYNLPSATVGRDHDSCTRSNQAMALSRPCSRALFSPRISRVCSLPAWVMVRG